MTGRAAVLAAVLSATVAGCAAFGGRAPSGATPAPAEPAAAPQAAAPAHPPISSAGPGSLDFAPRPDPEVFTVENPHLHEGRPLCQRCHVPNRRGVRGDPVALCAECHDPARMRHPFDVPENKPSGLPTGANGRIVCHTCHDPHAVTARKSGLRVEYKQLCLRCHARHTPGTPVH